MMKTLLTVLLLVAVRAFAASGVNDMYPDAELRRSQARYERRVVEMFSFALWEVMNAAEKQALAGVRLELPLKGDGPLDAFAHRKNSIPIVVLPALSLKFIEDLSIAYAWRHVNRHSLEPIDEYLAMLKYRRPEEFPGARVPDPLNALGIPPRIWERDKRVDELSLRFRNTAWAFILAHELGHLRLQHPGNRQVQPQVSQRNEIEADAFAVDLLSRSDTIPMGMILWFQASVGYMKNRADFPTEAEYREWMKNEATHPVNPERLQGLSVVLNHAADVSLSPNHAEVLRFIAGKVIGIGDILAEPDMQRLVARCAVLGRPEDLKRLYDRPCNQQRK
jgi:hypothetical protein